MKTVFSETLSVFLRKTRSILALCIFASAAASAQTSNSTPAADSSDLKQQVVDLRMLVEKLQARVDELEKKSGAQEAVSAKPASEAAPSAPATQAQSAAPLAAAPATSATPASSAISDFLHATTLNLYFDGYYGYNFNDPIGRVNLLRAYDISSNAYSINQADLVIENAPDPANGKRWGIRTDFQYGQATETLQGNPSNEPRPGIYQNIFQAYATYVVPIGNGLTVDFGKFASSLGLEGNYTKDQMNYSRSYLFDFLPFYHAGIRANYKFNDKVAVNYWSVNGTQQTEPFNGFKDEFFGLAITPTKTFTWNVNYYLGQEHPDVAFYPQGGAPAGAPTEQGVPFEPITNPPAGKLHIFDTYATWQVTPKWTVAGETDLVIQRLYSNSYPAHTSDGAGYIQYQWKPKLSFAARAEYLSDRGGLFTNKTQAIKETTLTAKYTVADNMLMFGEWRRDSSNQPFFYSNTLGLLKPSQTTAELGLVFWFGGKQGAW